MKVNTQTNKKNHTKHKNPIKKQKYLKTTLSKLKYTKVEKFAL